MVYYFIEKKLYFSYASKIVMENRLAVSEEMKRTYPSTKMKHNKRKICFDQSNLEIFNLIILLRRNDIFHMHRKL